MTKDIRHFTNELNNIVDANLRDFVRRFLMTVAPDYFWTIGASSSGKFHPAFTRGEGGLVRHVKASERVLEELLNLSTYTYMPDQYKDYARAAIIVHDCFKYGPGPELDREQYKNHGRNCAKMFNVTWYNRFEELAPGLLTMAIESHMGQWHGPEEAKPFTPIDRVVHMADYIASRSFIDMPEITQDWEIIDAIGQPPEGE